MAAAFLSHRAKQKIVVVLGQVLLYHGQSKKKKQTYKFDLFIATYGPACIFYDRTITIRLLLGTGVTKACYSGR